MYELLKKRIESKAYKLEKTLDLIDEMKIKEKITEQEADELYEFARTNAVAENSYASLQEQINTLFKEVAELKAIISKEEPTEPAEEYPTFKQPQNALDAYRIGDKITFNGKKYKCIVDYMVHAPSAYPQGWEEVTETEESVEAEE